MAATRFACACVSIFFLLILLSVPDQTSSDRRIIKFYRNCKVISIAADITIPVIINLILTPVFFVTSQNMLSWYHTERRMSISLFSGKGLSSS
ncbi:MAG: hypothetical protein B6245_01650 [Desulfobacteraceae bacterium 4572_88]|nr:MAG: hypothetical protein B6245_01650 [Desulfobacteraceae bacterium 4572_88]